MRQTARDSAVKYAEAYADGHSNFTGDPQSVILRRIPRQARAREAVNLQEGSGGASTIPLGMGPLEMGHLRNPDGQSAGQPGGVLEPGNAPPN